MANTKMTPEDQAIAQGDVTYNPVPQGQTGSAGSSDPAAPNLNLDILLNRTYQGLPPQGLDAIKQALKSQGVDNTSSFADFQKALGTVQQQYPQLQQYTPMGRAFPASAPGQLSAQTMQGLTDWTNAYQKPLTEAMSRDTSQVMDALKGLAPKLPAGYQNLIKTQQPGLQNMAGEISTMLAQAQPGAIANAQAAYYGGTTTPTAANLFSSLTAPKAPGT